MRIEKEIDLYKYSTMGTHSIGAVMYFPENIEDFNSLLIVIALE